MNWIEGKSLFYLSLGPWFYGVDKFGDLLPSTLVVTKFPSGWFVMLPGDEDSIGPFDTLDEAKAAAEILYETRT